MNNEKIMTLKEAILKSLQELKKPVNKNEVTKYILKKNFYDSKGKTLDATVSAILGNFIRSGDIRVKRKKKEKINYYYLTANEEEINFEEPEIENQTTKTIDFKERDLHLLLNLYLKKKDNIYSKTIFHEKSLKKDKNQKWIHPDIVGINFLKFSSEHARKLLKTINKKDIFKIYSYEIKREIKTEHELKKSFFQAVSNSSWANYGFLVAFEIGDNLMEEIKRLNHLFGIGVIELKAKPYESKILFPPKYKNLDFKTIDKLCGLNEDFKKFIEHSEYMVSETQRHEIAKKALINFCDKIPFNDDDDISIEKYCKENNIPIDDN